MSDPTIQSRLDDAAREVERLSADCAAQRSELDALRAELRLERALRTDAEGLVRVQSGELNDLTAERTKLRKALGKMADAAMTNGGMSTPTSAELAMLGVNIGNWPKCRAESDSK